MNPVVVFVTCESLEEARRIAKSLLDERLAACVNILDGVESHFWWGKRTHEATESLLIIKTKEKLLRKLIRKVKENHSYEVPEIIALPIIGGSKDYIGWVDEETGK